MLFAINLKNNHMWYNYKSVGNNLKSYFIPIILAMSIIVLIGNFRIINTSTIWAILSVAYVIIDFWKQKKEQIAVD
jgi:hypothetical protein